MASGKRSSRALGSRLLDWAEPLIRVVIYISGWSSILFVGAIFFFIIREAWPILRIGRLGGVFLNQPLVAQPR